MDMETISNGAPESVSTAEGYAHVVRRAIASAMKRNNTPFDGGWGFDDSEMTALNRYKTDRLQEIFGNEGVPEGWIVVWGAHVSYAGEEPEPRFERPDYTGQVIYTQDNNRSPEDRMVPSIEWRKTVDRPSVPA
jgi:hypothetical protein